MVVVHRTDEPFDMGETNEKLEAEERRMNYSSQNRRDAAIHEAGHAVASQLLDFPVKLAEVYEKPRQNGSVGFHNVEISSKEFLLSPLCTDELKDRAFEYAVAVAAGLVAEAIADGRDSVTEDRWNVEGAADKQQVFETALAILDKKEGTLNEVLPVLLAAEAAAFELLRENWTATEALSSFLFDNGRAKGYIIREFILEQEVAGNGK